MAMARDFISDLPDDIALSILDRLDVHSSMAVGVLSHRWKHLPWLRSVLNLEANNFKGQDMSAFTTATKSFLATTTAVSDHLFQSVELKFPLTDQERVTTIFEVLSDAICVNKVKQLCLDVSAEVNKHEASNIYASFFAGLVDKYSSSVFGCLNKLTIQQLSFAPSALDNLLKSCKQLDTLKMITCDCGVAEPWVIDAPDLRLRCLIFGDCDFGVISLLCLPRLEHLGCTDWFYSSSPIILGYLPCLKQLGIKNSARLDQEELMLSNMLVNTPNLEQLSLGFGAERIWIQGERAQRLHCSFSKLKVLSLNGIFLGCDLMWTMVLLESAPNLEALNIQVWETKRNDEENKIYGEKPKSVSWEVSNFQHYHLKGIELFGYKRTTSHLEFVRHVARRSICLEHIILMDDAFDSFLNIGNEERRLNFKSKSYKQYKFEYNGKKRLIRMTYTKKRKYPKRSS